MAARGEMAEQREVAAQQREVEAQREVAAKLEALTFDPSAAAPGPPGPREGEGGDEAVVPLGEAASCSQPAAAADSESDTDSDGSSTTSSSSSCSSSSTVSDEDDHPNEKDNRRQCVKTKDELPLDELPPVEDLSLILPDNVELKLFGTVSSIIEQLVIIESLRGLPPINEESIIFKEDRQAAGKIFEIFGPVMHPFYVLRFNSPEHIKEKSINVQDNMYFAPSVQDFTQYIFAEKLRQEKGSDASWKNDQEPPPEALDYSDDEKEREAKQRKKKPQNQGRKKFRSETNTSDEYEGAHQPVQQPASSYSRGYHDRQFSGVPFPPPSGPRGFSRPQMRPPQLYYSDNRIHHEPPVFRQPYRNENPMMQQYPFPPPVFGSGNEMHQFHHPPSNLNMAWMGPNMYNSSYPFLPPPPPPPPPPDSHRSPFKPY
ncbi:H/ACA ribonucleoprotein complex non-core subunit NAF1 [Cygnus olor]|uniref:H/ACA ribonucleoprotein complex non-core subunit NAF1 n=1 Tax=Cygnus olor TaxID=8869 RepID=UPI001ADDFFEE|nr:H/ACA ribonucleoprotein complex non-core subunit NAF1 [Cygnus olor]